jgi:protein-tyrosine-phosphatase
MRRNVLFLCAGNSRRSQPAEAIRGARDKDVARKGSPGAVMMQVNRNPGKK